MDTYAYALDRITVEEPNPPALLSMQVCPLHGLHHPSI